MAILKFDEKTLALAIQMLKNGNVVAFPTETVYGLGADATDDRAVAKIYEIKGRPHFNPLIAHMADLAMAEEYAVFSDVARDVAQQFWPGPLTLVLPQKKAAPKISPLASAGLPSIALRQPSHPIALALIQGFGKPVVAPSANQSGRISPTQASHVAHSLAAYSDLLIMDGGATEIGLESTILDLTDPDHPQILRPGGVPAEDLQKILPTLQYSLAKEILAPGMMKSHYAPQKPIRLNAILADPAVSELLIAFGPNIPTGFDAIINLSPHGDLTMAAANLFTALHEADQKAKDGIAVMPIPQNGLGVAINDRLCRAAAPKEES